MSQKAKKISLCFKDFFQRLRRLSDYPQLAFKRPRQHHHNKDLKWSISAAKAAC